MLLFLFKVRSKHFGLGIAVWLGKPLPTDTTGGEVRGKHKVSHTCLLIWIILGFFFF